MNDLISRQAAIDAFMIAISDGDKAEWCKWVLERLPSAKPEPLVKESRTLVKDLVKDTISRQVAINTDGLDEEIRCEMCRNQMKTDRGCDGNCKYDEKLYEKIMQILDKRIVPLPSAQPEPLSDAYMKAVWTWLLDYQIKVAELKGRYTPYEVLSWVVNDWRKEHERSD